jgi:hypothetical protein
MLHPMRKLVWMLVVGLWATAAAAQADCPTIVQNALDATDAACEGTGRNQACYGNIHLDAIPQEGVADFTFNAPGDIVDVAGVQTLDLQPLDAASDIWGVALMRLQANIPDTLPGQNVTFLLFGDVEMTNAVESNVEPVTFEVTVKDDADVRSRPSTDFGRIVRLFSGDTATANGRIEDGSWIRITLPDEQIGWVAADLVTTDGDISLLDVVNPADTGAVVNPMQAFYFKTGLGDAPCDQAPDSGILIQTPEGVGQITLTVNEARIQLGSTAYLQTLEEGEMAVNVVEHQATVSAQGVTQFVPAGSRVRVPLDANLNASGPPSTPEPYNDADLAALPVGHMPRAIGVAHGLTQAEIDALLASTPPVSGDWLYEAPTAGLSGSCDPSIPDTPPPTRIITLNVTDEFSAETVLRAISPTFEFPDNAAYENPEPGSYTADYTDESNSTFHMEMRFTSPTQAEGNTTLTSPDLRGTCTFETTFTLKAQ